MEMNGKKEEDEKKNEINKLKMMKERQGKRDEKVRLKGKR